MGPHLLQERQGGSKSVLTNFLFQFRYGGLDGDKAG
jgi:hypothetical protein